MAANMSSSSMNSSVAGPSGNGNIHSSGGNNSAAQPDALSLLSMALSAQSPVDEDAALEQLYDLLMRQPGNLPPLFPTLLGLLPRAGPGLHAWVLRVCQLAFNRPCLPSAVRMQLAIHVPEALLIYLQRGAPSATSGSDTIKSALQVLASIYPLLFRHACEAPHSAPAARAWALTEELKAQASATYDQLPPNAGFGAKYACFKLWQRAILIGTRAVGDQRIASPQYADANLAMIAPTHPFLNTQALEGEANRYLTQIITVVFTSSSCDLVMAALNTLALLAKARPSLAPIVLEALTSWTPAALVGRPHSEIRNAEKTLRVLFFHFHPERNAWVGASAHAQPLLDAIARQRTRMEQAAREEVERKVVAAQAAREEAERKVAAAAKVEGKRKADAATAAGRAKRVRWADDDGDQDALAASSEPPVLDEQEGAATTAGAGASDQADTEPASAPELDVSISGEAFAAAAAVPGHTNALATFNAAGLAPQLVVELTLATLLAVDSEALAQAIERTRSGIIRNVRGEREEALDPLRMQVDDEEDVLASAERDEVGQGSSSEVALAGNADLPAELVALEGFVLAPPERLAPTEAKAIVNDAIARICEAGTTSLSARITSVKEEENEKEKDGADVEGEAATALWSALVTRLATRAFVPKDSDVEVAPEEQAAETTTTTDAKGKGKEVQLGSSSSSNTTMASLAQQADAVRAQMITFITADVGARLAFAAQWMAEEWHCDAAARRRRGKSRAAAGASPLAEDELSNYDKWLGKLVEAILPLVEKKDKTLQRLLADVPYLPRGVIASLRSLCVDKERMSVGFTALRDVALARPPARLAAAGILLDLTRNVEMTTRGAAIITVRAWVGSNRALEEMVLQHGREGLKVISGPPVQKDEGAAEEGQSKPEAQDAKPTETVNGDAAATAGAEAAPAPVAEPTWDEADVLRYVELPFALCIKVPSMLEEVFAAFPAMTPSAQAAVQQHMAKLIRSLGPTHPTLLSCLRNFPDGAGDLALGALGVLMEKEKARPQALVLLVKELVEARDVSPRFLVPIMPDLDKAEIKRYLPRVVTLLRSGTPADRALVKDVFNTVVVKPPEGFGTLSTNLPRARQTSLLQPAELMGLLSHAEMEIGLRGTADAIRICFGMTDVFSSEVIAAVLNQIVEEPNLPTIFMRIALMAISTYKSLSTYVSGNLLTRLITKKIWQTPQLWEGFVICANRTAPASFGALIQLPREQLRDVLQRQPALRDGLREYLEKKAGGNRARLNGFLELLGDDEAKPATHNAAAAASAAALDSPSLSSAPATPIGANGT